MKIQTLTELRDDCLSWAESVKDTTISDSGRYKYNCHMLRPYGVESTAHIVFILWRLEALENYPDKENIVTFLQNQQDPETGYFKDPLLNDNELAYLTEDTHSWQHIWDHHTIVVYNALLHCNCDPLYPLPASSHVDLDIVNPTEWVSSLDWEHPYRVGENWMTTIHACHRKHNLESGQGDIPQLEQAFKAAEQFIDPESGLPVKEVKENYQGQALGGIFKMLFAYEKCDREYPYRDQAINSILAMQNENGDFVDNNMCMNWDAIFALRLLSKDLQETDHKDQIMRSCKKLIERLQRDYQKNDGGFSFFHNTCLPNHNSVRISAYYPESDVLGTTMCLDSIAIFEAWLAGEKSSSFVDIWIET